MNEEKIIEAQALAQDAQVAPAPVAADLVAEARELAAEGRSEPDPAKDNGVQEDPDLGEALSESVEGPLPDMAVLPTGGILEIGNVLDLLRAAMPEADETPDVAQTPDRDTTPTPEHPVYGAVYGRRF